MNIHGERFTMVSVFIDYCKDLNVKTDERELERYERIGAVFPVARVMFPDEYVIQRRRHELDDDRDVGWLADWPNAIRLDEGVVIHPPHYKKPSDEELIHRFDREMATGNNPYLLRPRAADFQPWDEYRVTVGDPLGDEIDPSTAEHYYSYWQVHQLYFIRKFPGFYRPPQLMDPLPKWLPEFDGKRHCFDALSFWITVSSGEKERTFANIVERNGIRRLQNDQADEHRERQRKLAEMVAKRFHLNAQALYKFLSELVEIYEEYEQDERYKLAEALRQDVFAGEHLLWFLTGETREQIADHLGVYKQAFRHLSITTKERDYALDMINGVSQRYGHTIRALGCAKWSFTDEDANALLDYCQREGLGILSTALSGMVAIGYDEFRQKSRRVLRYTSLKNILTAYEYLLKNLGAKADQNVGGATLTQAVNAVMGTENWFKRFKCGRDRGLLNGESDDKFLENLEQLFSGNNLPDSAEDFWARAFLVTCLARNMAVHSYPSDDRYYGDLFGPMLDAVTLALLYTWKLAQRKSWI